MTEAKVSKKINPTFCTCYNLPRQEKTKFIPSKETRSERLSGKHTYSAYPAKISGLNYNDKSRILLLLTLLLCTATYPHLFMIDLYPGVKF